MKNKTSLLVLCSCIVLSVFLLLYFDGLTKSPDLNDVDNLTVISKNYTMKIDDPDILSNIIKLSNSLKEVRKLDSYNINDFFTLTYTKNGKENNLFISSKYLINNEILYSGNNLSKLYKLIDNYIIANEPINHYLDNKTFYISMMDMPLNETLPVSQDIIDAIKLGSIDTDMHSKYIKDKDILSTIYTIQEFPAYKLHGSSLIDFDTVDIYIINNHLVYLDSNAGVGKFIDVPSDLYDLINQTFPKVAPSNSSIYYLFTATSLKYNGKDIKLKDGVIRALCGLYPVDIKNNNTSSNIILEAVLDGKNIEVSINGPYVEFNNIKFESPNATEIFNKIIKE